jgi:hypothetical protein
VAVDGYRSSNTVFTLDVRLLTRIVEIQFDTQPRALFFNQPGCLSAHLAQLIFHQLGLPFRPTRLSEYSYQSLGGNKDINARISCLLFMVGWTILLMGHAWPTKQEWNETSGYHQTFQHNEPSSEA